ncbi:MAG TPA: CPBP family intramembrane metalloprotease [Bacteroidales bacterium]|nr:CPBP family intramembrane metalloprotease [Bacteroidales bacterium]
MIFHPFLLEKPPYLKLLYFILIIICSLFLVNIFGMVLAVPFFGRSFIETISGAYDYNDPGVVAKLKYLQIINQLALFIVPVLIFAFFAWKNIPDYLKLNKRINAYLVLIAVSIILAGLPFINWLTALNSNMSLPEQLSGVEEWMRASETEAGTLTNAFLSSATVGGLLINVLMIAILPAIGEEFFFRGILQRLFSEWIKNVHIAIWVTAFIFSAFHMQFFGFLPRFLLGIYLGYLFYWSGTLWLPIIVHFINNGLAVVVAWLAARGMVGISYETFGSSDNLYVNLTSGLVVAGLIFVLYRIQKRALKT